MVERGSEMVRRQLQWKLVEAFWKRRVFLCSVFVYFGIVDSIYRPSLHNAVERDECIRKPEGF